MYGGTDRNADPLFRSADADFIASTTAEFGGRRQASQAFVEAGVKSYLVGDYSTAMKRFNQAWLINPANPEVFWGFGIVYHDHGENLKARDMMRMAIDAGLSYPSSVADAARVYTLCAVEDSSLTPTQKASQFAESDSLYRDAERASGDKAYVYGSWATAYYWRGDYSRAWDMVRSQEAHGGAPSRQFLSLLQSAMPDPR